MMANMKPGSKVDKFTLVSLLGSGSMGDVWLAMDDNLHRKVCVKFLKEDLMEDKELVERFKRESRTIAKLTHTNIVDVFECGVCDKKVPYFVMEYLEGITLDKYMKNESKVKWQEALKIIFDICSGLHHAHLNEIIHRDIKPSNIIVCSNGQIKITDFGLAKCINNTDITDKDKYLGTPAYLSPERWVSVNNIPNSDIFSTGIILYEMLSGENPFRTSSPQETYRKVMLFKPTNFRIKVDGVPPEIELLILHMIQRNTDKRFGAQMVCDEIKRLFTKYKIDMASIKFSNYNPTPETILETKKNLLNTIIVKKGAIKLFILKMKKQFKENSLGSISTFLVLIFLICVMAMLLFR